MLLEPCKFCSNPVDVPKRKVCSSCITKQKEERKEETLSNTRKRIYGITPKRYKDLLEKQENRCAICREPFVSSPRVDHCHLTGDVRGLLCQCCNSGLGFFRDCITYLQRAEDYLSKKPIERKEHKKISFHALSYKEFIQKTYVRGSIPSLMDYLESPPEVDYVYLPGES